MAKKPTKPTKTIEELKAEIELLKLLNADNYKEALHKVQLFIKEHPENADGFVIAARVNERLENYEEAIKDYTKAIELDPDYAFSYYKRGNAKGKLGQHEEAIKDYDKAIELQPERPIFHSERAKTMSAFLANDISKKLESTFEKQLEEYSNPTKIITSLEEEIRRTRFRLYGSLEDLENTEREHGVSVLYIARWGAWFIRYRLNNSLWVTSLFWFLALFLFFCLDIVGKSENYRELLCYVVLFMMIPTIASIKLSQKLQNKTMTDDTIPSAPFIGRFNTGMRGSTERASSRYRFIIPIIWLGIAYLFYRFYFNSSAELLRNIEWLDVLAFTTAILIISAPFAFHVSYLMRRTEQETVRLHALNRDSHLILFWQAQLTSIKGKDRTQLAKLYLKHMHANSTADISLRMMQRPLFGGKEKQQGLSLKPADLLRAIKNLTPPKAE